MTLRTGLTTFSYLLAGTGIFCLILSETFTQITGIVLIASLGIFYALEMKKIIPVRPSSKQLISNWNVLILPVLYFILDLPLFDLTIWFVVLLIFTRFLFKAEVNDYLFGYMLAIVCLFIGALYVQDITYGIVFILFYLTLSLCLIFYNMTVEKVGSHSPPEIFKWAGDHEKLPVSLFGASSGLIAISLVFTTFIFISFPRVGLSFLSLNSDSNSISGFSDNVVLGDVGNIKQNEAVVMRVEYSKGGKKVRPQSPILWRGVVLDHYNDNRWRATSSEELELWHSEGQDIALFHVVPEKEILHQDVYREAFDTDIVFTHGIPRTINGTFRNLRIDPGFVLKTGNPGGARHFVMQSEVGYPMQSYNFKSPNLDFNQYHFRYLQLPTTSTQFVQLAEQLTGKRDNVVAKAEAILDHLRDGFSYTLEKEAPEADMSPIDFFLFQRKKGHCEYFASAMTLLLRQAGVAARMVNGFAEGEWNALGEYLIVKEKHAHSWVEAFVPGTGWVVYDPTPPDLSLAQQSGSSVAFLWMDLLQLYWQRYVVRYSFRDQIEIFNFLNSERRGWIEGIKSFNLKDVFRGGINFSSFPLTGLLLTFLSGVGIFWYFFKKKSQTSFSTQIYLNLLIRLERLGIRKKPCWTHRELLKNLQALPPEKRAHAEIITHFYEKNRWGRSVPSESEKKTALNSIENI
jgi:protein-glutamine gamma-glutamyltransferase